MSFAQVILSMLGDQLLAEVRKPDFAKSAAGVVKNIVGAFLANKNNPAKIAAMAATLDQHAEKVVAAMAANTPAEHLVDPDAVAEVKVAARDENPGGTG